MDQNTHTLGSWLWGIIADRVWDSPSGSDEKHHPWRSGTAQVILQGHVKRRVKRSPPAVWPNFPESHTKAEQRQPLLHGAHLWDMPLFWPTHYGGWLQNPCAEDLGGWWAGHQTNQYSQCQKYKDINGQLSEKDFIKLALPPEQGEEEEGWICIISFTIFNGRANATLCPVPTY